MSKKHWKYTPEFEKGQDERPEGVDRREFLKLMGAALAMASAAGCTRRPVERIVPYLNKPEEVTPGVANWYATTCGECPAACGMLAKVREGRPIKLEGNPDHPMSQGGLCARGQASLLNLYDPDRLRGPVRRSSIVDRRSWEAVSWEEADEAMATILQGIKEKGGGIRLLTGSIESPATQQLIDQFLARFPNAKQVIYEPLSMEELREANRLSYGEDFIPHYRLDRAKLIVSFGADFLDTWLSPVEFTKQFSSRRTLQNGAMNRLVVFESYPTVTGSNADLHIPIRPGDEIKIALGLAGEYPLEKAAGETDVDPSILQRLRRDLEAHRGESLILGGGYSLKGEAGVALHVACHHLNHLLGNEGATIEFGAPSRQNDRSSSNLGSLWKEMRAGEVDLLLVYKANPAYTLPKKADFAEAVKKAAHVISLADRIDETALLSDWVLPDHHYLENWGDAEPVEGLYSLRQPTVAPLFNTRAVQETLLVWSGTKNWHRYLQDYWLEHVYQKHRIAASFQTFWETALRDGVWDARGLIAGHSVPTFNPSALSKAKNSRLITHDSRLSLIAYPTIPAYDGRSANNSWLKELPDPVSKMTWRNFVALAPARAAAEQLTEGDIVKLTTDDGPELELPVYIQPGLHETVAAVPLGFGRHAAGAVGNGLGANAFQFAAPILPVTIDKTGQWMKLPATQSHFQMHGRPIIKETTFAEYQKNPKAGNEDHHPLPSMWSKHKYEGHRWGMAIDLNACTGCSACMIACQAENNIPVVGEERVKQGREMHWIRIDRYYSGDENNPDVTSQPMLCQHCENAPCETVCPTLATLHNEEGLNVQAYNRCVGTRYCSNNCPYKVRRFNWFEFLWKTETPLAMVLNPDVTVREKGVMEKCTFCVQRIQEGKDKAKDFGRKVKDGEIKTACQQSCPADAIVFGDMNDPESRVSQLKKNPRGYHVLGELNVGPSITYLTKVRNKT